VGLPEHIFANPVWHSLETRHRHLAISNGNARRYPAAVAPFVAGEIRDLLPLLDPAELVWIFGLSEIPELITHQSIQVNQMFLPESVTPPEGTNDQLTCADAPDMVALTDIAFPGFFRPRTCEMGNYYGVRSESGELIAMGGERMMPTGYSELSGVCTHPDHRGKGYAAALMWQLVRDHRKRGEVSWLHVTNTNSNAIALYERMGFRLVRTVTVTQVGLRERV
jgi:GNAT superfamily N-acetyltransferase